MNKNKINELSRFISKLLRHEPELANIDINISIVVIGKASGNFSQSTSADEEIEAGWFSKAEVKELLSTENFAARTQAYLQMWIKNG